MVIFIAWIDFILLEQKINLNLMKKYAWIKFFCGFVIPSEKDNILKFNQYMKSDKIPYIIYANIESLIKKTDGTENNPTNSSTTKIGEHIPCGYSITTIWSHRKQTYFFRGKGCRKKFVILWENNQKL